MFEDEREFHGFDLRSAKLARFVIRRRRETLVLQPLVLIACVWGWLGERTVIGTMPLVEPDVGALRLPPRVASG